MKIIATLGIAIAGFSTAASTEDPRYAIGTFVITFIIGVYSIIKVTSKKYA